MQRCVCVNCCSRHFERPVFPRVGVAVRRSAISQTPRSSHLVSKVRRRGLARLLPTRVKRMVRQCRRVSGKLLGSIALGSFRVCRGCVPADRDEHLHASKAKKPLVVCLDMMPATCVRLLQVCLTHFEVDHDWLCFRCTRQGMLKPAALKPKHRAAG